MPFSLSIQYNRYESRSPIFKKLFGAKPIASAEPYTQTAINLIYQLLFCDDPTLFQPQPGAQPAPWQTILFSPDPDATAIRALAADPTQESRIRMLAYNWLRKNQQTVPPKELLGIIVEVPPLAAYADHRVRYINQTGKIAVFEPAPPDIGAQAAQLLAVSRTAVDKIGPWDKPRLPPPAKRRIRLTFLVSDGLYFGEGPFPGMDRDPLAAPIINEATKLLQMVAGQPPSER